MVKLLNIIKSILVWNIAIIAVGMMIFTFISVYTFDRTDRKILGYRAFIVLSDSMSATDFSAGDLVLIKDIEPATLKIGDIISYQSVNSENYGEVVTHKIRKLTVNNEGKPGFITYGTTTDKNDENVVTYDFVLGKYKTRLKGLGKFFQFLKTTPGYIICIFIPFLALIVLQGIKSIKLFHKYKDQQINELVEEKEKQKADLELQRAQIQKEMEQSKNLMAELLKMKSDLKVEEDSKEINNKSKELEKDISPEDKIEMVK